MHITSVRVPNVSNENVKIDQKKSSLLSHRLEYKWLVTNYARLIR